VGKPERKRTLGIPRRRLINNMKMDRGKLDWIDHSQVRDRRSALVNTVMNLRVP
jgi:hypothetical protein